jgi:hypothetical protein
MEPGCEVVTLRCTVDDQIKRAFFFETRGASLGGRVRQRRGLESSAWSSSDDTDSSECYPSGRRSLLACCRFPRRTGRADQST